ncbi:hypothetical protein [Pseudofrankia sp. DC12]|uniref:hypothetical protein n=1 Tax=Pseudofrankia sp. DC12 TaxID=683315 RepID=UPI001E3796AE|nr:hypothetical protein [Pseudofrankia sp. DC12]
MIHRRDFLAGAAGLSALAHLESYLVTLQREPAAQVAVLRAALSAQRLRDGTLPPTELADIVAGHLRLLRDVAVAAGDEETVASAHEAASEGFGFLAWLAWDTWEIGSAQRHYRTAVRFARASGHPTLPAYMLGSAAAFAAQTGDLHRAVLLVGRSQQALPVRRHPVADAWMDAVSASVYAAAGDEHETWRSLDAAETAVGRIPHGEAPPWPWIMRFDKAKLAGYRLTAAVDLRRPQVALDAARDLTAGTNPNRNAQHGLTLLREADAHAQAGDYDQCAALATHALVTAAPTSSQRVIRAAWHTRHAIPGQTTSEEIRRFDAALHGTDPADI